MAERLLPGLTHLFLVFEDCGIGEAGACAVAERLPVGLTVLALVFGGCGMEEAGARAVAGASAMATTRTSIGSAALGGSRSCASWNCTEQTSLRM